MAIRCCSSSSTLIIIPRKTNKTLPRVLMLHKDDKQQSKHTSLLSAKSTIAIKVFEDQEAGIVCYRDEKGEVICEGHDEGPRFCQREVQTCSYGRFREVQSFDFLHQWWLQIIEDSNFDNMVSGVAVQDKK
ncbi:hypothetical protein J5N97_006876 [Dioscorea zingiberensis]|uniref:Uncharacterized protein n=1 Tax=Dioscorea zingiberensis TaxID=325984 RepID=A0A9D5DB68_9LILI|nr:hypothetical protein J5N97_006876 [Dioscorea zingiberensis]